MARSAWLNFAMLKAPPWIVLVVLWLGPAVARAERSFDRTLWVASVSASSTLHDEPTRALRPELGLDKATGQMTPISSWCEGKSGPGIGETLTIKFARPANLRSITLMAGVWSSEAAFSDHDIPTEIRVVSDDGRRFAARPSPLRRERVDVPIGGAAVTTLTFAIAAVKAGKIDDTCISDIRLNEGVGSEVIGYDAAAIAELDRTSATLWAALWPSNGELPACDATVLARYVDFPFAFVEAKSSRTSHHVVPVRRKYATAKEWQADCRRHAFLYGHPILDDAAFDELEPGILGIGFTVFTMTDAMTDARFVMKLRWRDGAWRLIGVDVAP